MKILVTGASGYLGHQIVDRLAKQGHHIVALVRSDQSRNVLNGTNIQLIKGDITDRRSLIAAMNGVDQVYHTAAKVGAWAKQPAIFYQVNSEGTKNVMQVALDMGVSKVVYTSSCGVIGPSNGKPNTEKNQRPEGFGIHYDLSKKEAEEICLEYAGRGLDVVAVLPPKLYGPGQVSHSLTGNALIARFVRKGIALVPSPGNYKVCFAYIDDVVNGHLLAMHHGIKGERYILGGVNISYLDFFDRIRTLSSSKGRIYKIPKSVISLWAKLQILTYRITGKEPLFDNRSVDFAFHDYEFSSEKAMQELGYTITPLDEALHKTIQYIKEVFPD